MKSATILRERLKKRQLTIGVLATNHMWLELIEIGVKAGLDYMIVDLEHVSHGDTLVADACRIGRMCDFPILIRPARTDRESVRLALDLGACGLLLPMIESAEQLDEVAAGALMPPRGERRPGGHGNWWVNNFNYDTWKRDVEDDWIILPQIESPKGVANASAIANHPLVTAMAVGPYDLSARLGVCWDPTAPVHKNAIQAIRDAADAAGKSMWMIGHGPDLVQRGFHFLCIAEPSNLLYAILKDSVAQLRQADPAAPPVQTEAFVP